MLWPDAGIKWLHAACQGHVNSLDLSDMRGLLDNAAGEGGPDSAALPQDRRRSSDTHPVYYSGPCNWEGPSGEAGCCASTGHGRAALVCRAALSLGQVSQSHGGVYLPPALMDPSMLGSIRLLLPVNTLKDASAQIKILLISTVSMEALVTFCLHPHNCSLLLWRERIAFNANTVETHGSDVLK